MSHSHNHRRSAVCYRHCRDGPSYPAQRHRLSGRAVEAAGDVDVLLLDKTGTITLGNRQAVEFIPVGTKGNSELAEAAQMASLADETPEGRSIVLLAKRCLGYVVMSVASKGGNLTLSHFQRRPA